MTDFPVLRRRPSPVGPASISLTGSKWYAPAMLGVALIIAMVFVGMFAIILRQHPFPVGDDLRIYVEASQRLLSGGSWYESRQLDGPYPIQHGDVLYPPVFAWFVMPWYWLPGWTYVALAVVVVAWHVIDVRPAPWTWPLIAFGALYPWTLQYAVFANPSFQMVLFFTLAIRWPWTGSFILVKPTLGPFALVRIRDWRWWAGLAVLVIASLPFLAATLAYPRVLLDSVGGGLAYNIHSIPLMAIPLVTWLGGRRRPAGREQGIVFARVEPAVRFGSGSRGT